ncbi:MAG: cadherin-like beta sandwich domain-containing protein [Paenibacillaceae bacterium]
MLKRRTSKLLSWIIFGTFCCIALFQWSADDAFAAPATGWTQKANLPKWSYGTPVAAGSDGKIYALVNDSYGSTGTKLFAYDPASDTWATKTDLPKPDLFTEGFVNSGGKLYVIGGQFQNVPMTDVYVYYPGTDAWTVSTSLPVGLNKVSAAVTSNGTIYVVGNSAYPGPPMMYEYQPGISVAWTQISGLPSESGVYSWGAAAASDGNIYLIEHDIPGKSWVYSYNPGSGVWTQKANTPKKWGGSYSPSLVQAANGLIYHVAGMAEVFFTNTNEVYAYDPVTDIWLQDVNYPAAMSNLGVVAGTNGLLYGIAGDISTGSTDDVYEFNPGPAGLTHTSVTTTGWTENWRAVPGASSYNVYLDGSSTATGTVSGTMYTYSVTGMNPGTAHSIQVTAVTASGESAAFTDNVTTITSAPAGLAHTAVSTSGWTENWNAVIGASSYNVYVDGVQAATGIAGTSYTVTGQTPGTNYAVTVTALNSTGLESAASSVDSVTTVSTDASLSTLTLSGVTLDAAFASGTLTYTANIANSVTSTTVAATKNEPNATITAADLGAKTLAVGENTLTVHVTAQDGTTTSTYTVTVTRAPSADATLSTLTLSGVTLDAAFASGTLTYTANVANSVTSTTVAATANEPNATITAADLGAKALAVGQNTLTVHVTAQDGTTTSTYTVTVTRAPSADASLNALTLSGVTLDPAFASGTLTYTANVANSVTSTTVAATVNEPNATITAADLGAKTLAVGENTFTVHVTAQDGTTTSIYTVTVRRVSNNADLSDLKVIVTTLAGFAPGTTDYTIIVPKDTTSVVVTATTPDPNASVVVNGNVGLVTGDNAVTVTVTAEDGTQKVYAVTVNVLADIVPVLTDSQITGTEDMELVFTALDFMGHFTDTDGDSLTGITVVTLPTNGILKVNGVAVTGNQIISTSILNSLSFVPNADWNGTTFFTWKGSDGTLDSTGVATFTIIILPSNADLSSLTISDGALSPLFSPSTTDYSATVSNDVYGIMITPTVSNNTSTVTINGQAAASGTPYSALNLQVGSNVISLDVKAFDGTSKIYTLTVYRYPSDTVRLTGLTMSAGGLTPDFSGDKTSYVLSVLNAVSSITVTASVYDINSSVTANIYNDVNALVYGPVTVIDGHPSNPLSLGVGANRIELTVASQDGTATQTYTITVTRAIASYSNAYLQSLQISADGLAFDKTTSDYTVSVGHSVDTLTITAAPEVDQASVTINGATVTSQEVSLNVGDNPVAVEVTAQDGTTIKTYSINIKRAIAITAVADTPIQVTNNPISITIPSSVTNASIAVAPTTVGSNKEVTLPLVEFQAATTLGNVNVAIPAGTTITAPANWDGIIHLPQVQNNSSVSVSHANVSAVIEIGSSDVALTFDHAVRILLPNQGGKSAGYVRGSVLIPITSTITADTQAAADNELAAGADAAITVGSDLVIWTKHFTQFVSYTSVTPSSSSGGGRGYPIETLIIGTLMTSSGGTLTLNGVQIDVPVGATDGNIQVTVNKVSDISLLPADPALLLVSDVYEITKDQDGDFSKPVVITLPFDKTKVDFGKSTVNVYWLSEQTHEWAPLDNPLVDQINATVSGAVEHFTKFAVLASALTEDNPPQANDIDFTDIKGHWAEASIQELVKLGAISGYPDNTFKPDSNITRAEFITVIVRTFHLEATAGIAFADTPTHWAKDSIATAAALGVVRGYNESDFGPDDPITREQMAAIVIRVARIETANQDILFSDRSDVSDWARSALVAAVANDLISGYEDGTVKPQAYATRAEAVTVIRKALQLNK